MLRRLTELPSTYFVKCRFPYRKNCVEEMDCPMAEARSSPWLAGTRRRTRGKMIVTVSRVRDDDAQVTVMDFFGVWCFVSCCLTVTVTVSPLTVNESR
jgi:hypothetical protein